VHVARRRIAGRNGGADRKRVTEGAPFWKTKAIGVTAQSEPARGATLVESDLSWAYGPLGMPKLLEPYTTRRAETMAPGKTDNRSLEIRTMSEAYGLVGRQGSSPGSELLSCIDDPGRNPTDHRKAFARRSRQAAPLVE